MLTLMVLIVIASNVWVTFFKAWNTSAENKKDLLLILLDVTDVVAAHRTCPHMADERKQLVLWVKERIKLDYNQTVYVIEIANYEILKNVGLLLHFMFLKAQRPPALLCFSVKLTAWSVSDARPRRRVSASLALCSWATTFRHIHGLQVIQVGEDPVHCPIKDITLWKRDSVTVHQQMQAFWG